MYYVTLADLPARALPNPVIQLLGDRCSLVEENRPLVLRCEDHAAVSAVISVVTRAELSLTGIRVSRRRPDHRRAAAAD